MINQEMLKNKVNSKLKAEYLTQSLIDSIDSKLKGHIVEPFEYRSLMGIKKYGFKMTLSFSNNFTRHFHFNGIVAKGNYAKFNKLLEQKYFDYKVESEYSIKEHGFENSGKIGQSYVLTLYFYPKK